MKIITCIKWKRPAFAAETLRVAETLAKTMLRLPIFSEISREQQDYVCDHIFDFYK